jgi:HSP20 family protein
MGQLVNVALGDPGTAWLAELQIKVELQDREVIVTGEATDQVKGRRHRSSRRTGRFEYRAMLPGDVNPEGVIAQLADGVLAVTVPKSEAARPREIEVSDN